jgi:photosystem II stability/assembly factor-like uncharacterized protein
MRQLRDFVLLIHRIPARSFAVIALVALLGAASAPAATPLDEEEQEAEGEDPLEDYFRWLTENRLGPDKGFGSLLQAWREVEQTPKSNGATEALWEFLGPAPLLGGTTRLGGRTNSIAIDTANPGTLYIGAALGGVWKSTDAGTSWVPLTDDQPSLAMGSVVIDPSDSNIIYAGTGEQNFSGDSYYGAGLLRSMDAGATWTRLGESEFVLPGGGGATISRVVLDAVTPSTVYVASNFGLFKSVDRGGTWELKLSGRSPLAAVTDLAMDPTDPRTLYAGLGLPASAPNKGIYKSTDSGETWTELDIGLPPANIGRINFDISRSNPQILYAAVHNPQSPFSPPIFRLKTTDGGLSWGRLPDCSGSCGQGAYNLVVAVHPQNPDIVYQGAVALFRSLDGGATWSTRSSGHVDHHGLKFDDQGNLYVASDGGLFLITAADQLISLNTNLGITQFYAGVALHPLNPAIILAGTQDNGSDKYTGVLQWSRVCGGDGAYQAIEGPVDGDPDNIWYCSSQRLYIRKTIDNGATFINVVNGITDRATGSAFIAPFVMDPNVSQALIAGTRFVWRTENGALNWVQNSGQLTEGTIRSLAFARLDSGTTYFAGTNLGEIWRTTNAGADWTPISQGLPANRVVTHLAVHPFDSSIVYATFSGFGTGHVFRSRDQGDTWQDISSNLPNLPTTAVLIDAYAAIPTLYAGTDLGVFRSLDDGVSWERFSPGLPNVRVEDLILNPDTGMLVASTHGRGIWQLVAARAGSRKQ